MLIMLHREAPLFGAALWVVSIAMQVIKIKESILYGYKTMLLCCAPLHIHCEDLP
jgi:hypothetical protein